MTERKTFTKEDALKCLSSTKERMTGVMLALGGQHRHFKPLIQARSILLAVEQYIREGEYEYDEMDEDIEARKFCIVCKQMRPVSGKWVVIGLSDESKATLTEPPPVEDTVPICEVCSRRIAAGRAAFEETSDVQGREGS